METITTSISKTIFELTQEQSEIEILLDELSGELTPEISERLETLKTQLIKKADSILHLIEKNESEEEQCAVLEKKWGAMKTIRKKRVERLKNLIIQAMTFNGRESIPTATGTIKISESKASNIVNEKLIPAKYKTIKQETVISKADILKDLKNGVEIPGAELQINHSLRIS